MTGQGNSNAAKVYAIMGATGCGKTTHLRKLIGRPKRKRTLIWSPKEVIDRYADLYPGTVTCTTAGQVLEALKAAGKGPVHIVFAPPADRKRAEQLFGHVCRLARVARNMTVIVDEMHTVTRPSWAPDGWSELIMMGRGYGAEVFGLSQRPASVDKDFFSNVSAIHCRRMAFDDDAKVMAKALRVPVADVLNLTGYQWINRDILTGQITRG